jgi:hypothetical protein
MSTNIFPLADYTLKLPPPPPPPPVSRPVLPPPDYVVNRAVNVPQPPPLAPLPSFPTFSPPKFDLPPPLQPSRLDLPSFNLPKLPGFGFAAFDPAKLPGFNEVMEWAKNRNVDVYKFDGGATVLVDPDSKEGYLISRNGVKKLDDASLVVKELSSAANAPNWLELAEVKSYKDWIESLPPGLREVYAAAVGAGQFAAVAPAADVLARWLQGKDPTTDIEKFKLVSAAASQASPWAYLAGTGVGLGGAAGLGLSYLAEKGAALGAQGLAQEVLTGLRASAKPALIGTGLGFGAGAAEGALTGRNPAAEGAKYGAAGLMLGLGGITREQLLAALAESGLIGGTTAKKYGLEKGLEAGSTAFFLPLAAPVGRGLGSFTLDTAKLELLTKPAAEGADVRPAVELPTVNDVRTYMLLTGKSYSDTIAELARRAPPDGRRDILLNVVETAVSRLRMGYDRDAVVAVLQNVRQKLDPASRKTFDELLAQYGLLDVKHSEPEYALTDEAAKGLALFAKYREPEYALTDEAAAGLNRFFKLRGEPQYALTDQAASQLAQFLKPRSEPQYSLTDEAAGQLALFFRRPEDGAADNAVLRARLLQRLRPQTEEGAAGGAYVDTSKTGDVNTPKTDGAVGPKTEAAPQKTGDGTAAPTTTPTTTPTVTTPATTSSTTPTATTPTTTPSPPPPIVITPQNLASYLSNINIPVQLLFAPVAVAVPILQQYLSNALGAPVQLRLPPPPNPYMPLGTYLRSVLPRAPALLGGEREVYVLI